MEAANPYEAPKSALGNKLEASQELPKLIAAYVDQNVDYYQKHIPSFMSGKKVLGFNISAAILTVPWLAYRKMYLFLLAYFPIPFAFVTLLEYPYQKGLISSEMKAIMFAALIISLKVGMGLLGNFFYLRKAKSKAIKIASELKEEKGLMEKLAFVGGTSGLACTLAMAMSALLNFVSKMA